MLKFILKKPTGFILLTLVLIATGVGVFFELPVMMYPRTRRPRIQINLNHPGISAVDFQSQYAESIESRLMSLESLDMLETTYSTDQSRFDMTFNWDVDSDQARVDVESLMVSVNASLPAIIRDSYSVRYREGENAGYLIMGLTSETLPSEELYQALKTNMEPRLQRIQDLEEIGFYNTQRLIAEITLDPYKMLAYGITINDVDNAMQQSFQSGPIGSLSTEDGRFSVRLKKDRENLSELPQLKIKQVGNSRITLDDIAQIDIRYTLPQRLFLVEGVPAVQLTATPVEGGNVSAMSDAIIEIISTGVDQGLVPEDLKWSLYLDPAKYIRRSIENVVQAALMGGLLAVIAVFLILGEWKNTLLIGASLPVTIIFSFLFMRIFDVSLNLISLGGLALAVGMIVDSTIVVMENIHRHRILKEDDPNRILHWRTIVIEAVHQVRSPVIASTLTSVLVFLPISFTAPLTNAILGDQARTVIFALLGSLVVSLTIVPMAAFYIFRHHQRRGRFLGFFQNRIEGSIAFLTRIYSKSLAFLLKKKSRAFLFLLVSAGMLGGSVLWVLPQIPKEIISTPTSDRVVLFFRNSAINDPEEIMRDVLPEMNAQIEEALGDLLVQKFTTVAGRFNQVFLDIRSPKETQEAIQRLEKIFISQGDWYYNILAWDPAALPLPYNFDFQLSLFGPDAAKKVELLGDIQTLLMEEELFTRMFSTPSSSITQELNLSPRDMTINALPPWNEGSLSSLIRRVLSGTRSLELSQDSEDIQVTAAYPENMLSSQEDLEDFLIPWKGQFIPLKHFFTFSTTQGVSQVAGENGEAIFRLYGMAGFRISDAKRLEMQEAAQDYLRENLVLPEGYSFRFDNPRAEMDRSIESLFTALGISVILIYLLLAFQFNSLRIPLIILVTIPLGFIGVIFSLWIFKSALNLNSLLGTILLGGIVVNNAIIMIDFYQKSHLDYTTPLQALIETAGIRFQPILITTLTTVLGMLPLAIGLGEGSNILQPLGIAVSGGLLVSTIFTLYAVPSLMILTQAKHRHHRKEVAQ